MANWTDAATGAIGGASTGGSVFGVPGAVIGGALGGISGLFGGKKKKRKKVSSLDKRQQALNGEQFAGIHGEGPLADLYDYDPEAANAVFDQNQGRVAYRDLNEKSIPALTGSFRKNGLMNSSYAGDAIGKLTRDVQEKLMGERSQYLYNEQSDSRNARRNAVENYQNRTTFDYDNSKGANVSGIDSILKSISPEMIAELKNYFT